MDQRLRRARDELAQLRAAVDQERHARNPDDSETRADQAFAALDADQQELVIQQVIGWTSPTWEPSVDTSMQSPEWRQAMDALHERVRRPPPLDPLDEPADAQPWADYWFEHERARLNAELLQQNDGDPRTVYRETRSINGNGDGLGP